MTQMDLSNVTDKIFAENTFAMSSPSTTNLLRFIYLPDTMGVFVVLGYTLARNPSTTNLKGILADPSTRHHCHA
ncbi:hypothetical protein J3R82DRAFT_5365 [Butyriboletus roseoflavus]|nr:hypothetical protein J3R82DRAFT_5365 [Butyriboletus roseoflavus]